MLTVFLLLTKTFNKSTSQYGEQSSRHRIINDRIENYSTYSISSSSQSSIATLKDVLADGRLMSSPPLPLLHPLAHPPTTPIPYTYRGGLWVRQRVWGGGGELVNLLFAKKFLRTLRAKADCA